MKKLLILLPIFLMACSSATTSTPSSATLAAAATASQEVYRLEGYYAAARTAENAYYDLPRCGLPTSPKLCSNLSTLRAVRKADNTAYSAIMAADGAVNTPGFSGALASAESLVNMFTAVTNKLPKK